jgi:hypothetical protein
VPEYRGDLAGTLSQRATFLRDRLDRRDLAAARQLYEEALLHYQKVLEANPGHAAYRQSYRSTLGDLVPILAGLGNQAAAVQAAEKLRDLGGEPAVEAYDAAAALAQCVPVVDKDEALSPEQRQQQAQFYAERAMAMLRHAVTKGFKDVTQLKKDKDLDPLRKRDDFQQLLAELEANRNSRPR